LRLDVSLHGRGGGGCEGEARDGGEGGAGLSNFAVSDAEIVAPLEKRGREEGREVGREGGREG
jgi:hypothetical protein